MRAIAALIVSLFALSQHAAADVGALAGSWRGQAVLAGDVTTLLVEFAPCESGVCARLDLPELGYAGLPLGPVTEEGATIRAGLLTLTRDGDQLSGALAGHGGGLFLDAMGHGGGEAQARLVRARTPRAQFIEEEVRFQNGAATLAGTLVRPRTRGPHPAIVAVLGSGPAVRWHSLGRAREWARLGYAVLIYDKRGTGESTGDWTQASLDDLADDAGAAVRYLHARRDIRAERIGLWAHSQGGWVAPRAIARGASAAFLIAVSGGGATPEQVERYGYNRALDHMSVTGAERARAEVLIDAYFTYLRGDIDLAAMRAAQAEVSGAPWYRGLGVHRVIPNEEARGFWRWVATYHPADDIAALAVPTFVALAGADESSPLSEAASAWSRALAHTNGRSTITVYPGADHHVRLGGAQGWRRVSPAYSADIERFLRAQAR